MHAVDIAAAMHESSGAKWRLTGLNRALSEKLCNLLFGFRQLWRC